MSLTLNDLLLPPDWSLLSAVDTGTYMAATIAAISPDPHECVVLCEHANYHYVGSNEIELLNMTITEWAQGFLDLWSIWEKDRKPRPWVDANTQFAHELQHHGIMVRKNDKGPEVRTEISREYFQANKIHFMPWCTIAQFEAEQARWPDDVNAAGQYKRLKVNDHVLDTIEHMLSRRPRSKTRERQKSESFIEKYLRTHTIRMPRGVDPHLGPL